MSPHLSNKNIGIQEYDSIRIILNDSKLIKNPVYASRAFNIPLEKVKAIIEEYEKSGCIILNSKMNGRYKID